MKFIRHQAARSQIWISFRASQFKKASPSMEVTLSGIVTLVRLLQPLKAYAPMLVSPQGSVRLEMESLSSYQGAAPSKYFAIAPVPSITSSPSSYSVQVRLLPSPSAPQLPEATIVTDPPLGGLAGDGVSSVNRSTARRPANDTSFSSQAYSYRSKHVSVSVLMRSPTAFANTLTRTSHPLTSSAER